MKIITLNAWCGRAGSSVHDFFKNYGDTDIFCLQEVDLDGSKFGKDVTGANPPAGDPFLFRSIQDILPGHHGFFAPILSSWWGNAIFISNELYRNMTAYGEVLISDEQQKYMEYDTWFRRSLQWVDFSKDGELYTVVNYHGLWERDKGKGDSPDRIEQSQNIINFLETKKERKIILTGDFNLSPDTDSLKMLSNLGLINLISEFNITDTRTSLYEKENRFADYTFISPEIKVKEFKVLPDEVSDHAPLLLEIEQKKT
ncbi:MAG: endonuclease/exonuclease/phosphatase family protein [Candidatus Pacebacteria bacterium]|nr:endonuclease/exonuclease/phosphatase family protein [Candidatus Paceibacterota bacterium]